MAIQRPTRVPMEIEDQTDGGDLGSKRMIVNFGPQHPATHGTLRSIMEIDGEIVKSMELEIGYLHTGFEKLGEYRTYNQTVTITDRMNYLSPLCNNIGFSCAVERMMGIEVTPRCAAIRVVMYELSRIADHILCVGLQAMDLGAFSMMLWAFIEREKLYDIFENVTGARLTTSYTRIGGLLKDVPPDFEDMCRKFMETGHRTIREMEGMLNGNKIFRDRTIGVNVIGKEDAISYGLTGPLLRATGVPYDLRRARPYLGYDQYDWDVITAEGGDVWARYRVRVDEMYQSLRIIDQALKTMPSGPVNIEDPEVVIPTKDATNHPNGGMEGLIYHFKNYMFGHGVQPEPGEAYFATEAPNGELGYYLVSDGTQKPYRWRVRPPSLYNYQAFPDMCRGGSISDVVSGLSSLNIIAGELDR
ncbi:MAG: NADH-quinone oxidoreductase subunit D [Myxococcota bacterium]